MDFLPLDGQGMVPTVDFRRISNDQWVGLNASCDSIPLEAAAFINHQRTQRISDDFQPKGPTGLFLDMEWALDADWFDPDAGWRPYLPLPAEGSSEWYFQLDQSMPADLTTIPPLHTIFPRLLSTMEDDLRALEGCVMAISQSSIFPIRGARLGNYNYIGLQGPFDSIQTLTNRSEPRIGIASDDPVDTQPANKLFPGRDWRFIPSTLIPCSIGRRGRPRPGVGTRSIQCSQA